MEQLNLTFPVTYPNTTSWKVDELHLRWSAARIDIRLLGSGGESKHVIYSGSTATTLMSALNKANLSTNSLHKRILNQLVTDGEISGTVSGSPD